LEIPKGGIEMKKKILKIVDKFTDSISHLDIFHDALAKHLVIELTKERIIHPADDLLAQEIIRKAMKGNASV
jgi:hypothetical protein